MKELKNKTISFESMQNLKSISISESKGLIKFEAPKTYKEYLLIFIPLLFIAQGYWYLKYGSYYGVAYLWGGFSILPLCYREIKAFGPSVILDAHTLRTGRGRGKNYRNYASIHLDDIKGLSLVYDRNKELKVFSFDKTFHLFRKLPDEDLELLKNFLEQEISKRRSQPFK